MNRRDAGMHMGSSVSIEHMRGAETTRFGCTATLPQRERIACSAFYAVMI